MSHRKRTHILPAVVLGVIATGEPTEAWAIDSTALRSSYHDRCLQVDRAQKDGSTIRVSACAEGTPTQWVFEPTLDGAFVVRNPEHNQCMDVSEGKSPGYQKGDPVIQWGCHREVSQQWDVTSVDDAEGAFTMKSRASGLCAEVLYTNEIIQVDCHPSTHQVFRGNTGIGTHLTLDKEDYLPKTSAQIEFTFGTFVSQSVGTDAWIGILPDSYDPKTGSAIDVVLSAIPLRVGEGRGHVNLMVPDQPGTYVVRAFQDEKGDLPLGSSISLTVREWIDAPIESAEVVAEQRFDGIDFCGQRIAYTETVVACHDVTVTDLTPLLELDVLKSLNLSGSGIFDLTQLQHLPSIEYLHINNTDVSDLSPLAHHESLVYLNIAQTSVVSIEALHELTDLRVVNIMGTALAQDERKTKKEIKELMDVKSSLEVII